MKKNIKPVTFRSLLVHGLVSPDEIIAEYDRLVAENNMLKLLSKKMFGEIDKCVREITSKK